MERATVQLRLKGNSNKINFRKKSNQEKLKILILASKDYITFFSNCIFLFKTLLKKGLVLGNLELQIFLDIVVCQR